MGRPQGTEGSAMASGVASESSGKAGRRGSKSSVGSRGVGGESGRGDEGGRKGSRPVDEKETAVAAYKRALAKVRHETVQESLRQGQAREKGSGPVVGRYSPEARRVLVLVLVLSLSVSVSVSVLEPVPLPLAGGALVGEARRGRYGALWFCSTGD